MLAKSPTHRVLFDCERMRKSYTGLFYYNLYLGKHLVQECERQQDIEIVAYVPSAQDGVFGHHPYCSYLYHHALHKLFLPNPPKLDIWHCTFQASSYFPYKRNDHCKVVLTVHDINFFYDMGKTEAKKQRYAQQLRKKIERADHIIVISDFVRQDLLKHGLLSEDKPLSVIYNSHCLSQLQVPDKFKPSFVPPKPFLFSMGTIMRKKNFHVLPAMLVGNDFHLVIAGTVVDKHYLEEIHQAIKTWGVEDRVTVLPPVSDMERIWYYQNCRAFLFLSLSEGFGIPVIEAMSFGKPVLLSRLTSLPEIGGDVASYVDSFEPKHMQDQLRQCLHEYDTIDHRKEDIMAHARRFDWQTAAQQHLNVYRSLLA